nr:trna-specific adenosine deaminase subunit tad3 [Quercus suber]
MQKRRSPASRIDIPSREGSCSLGEVIQQGKLQPARQVLRVLQRYRRADLPLAAEQQRVAAAEAAAAHEQAQARERGELRRDVKGAAQVVGQDGVQNGEQAVEREGGGGEQVAGHLARLARASAATSARGAAAFLAPLLLGSLHEVHGVHAGRVEGGEDALVLEESSLVDEQAAEIPGAKVALDDGGHERAPELVAYRTVGDEISRGILRERVPDSGTEAWPQPGFVLVVGLLVVVLVQFGGEEDDGGQVWDEFAQSGEGREKGGRGIALPVYIVEHQHEAISSSQESLQMDVQSAETLTSPGEGFGGASEVCLDCLVDRSGGALQEVPARHAFLTRDQHVRRALGFEVSLKNASLSGGVRTIGDDGGGVGWQPMLVKSVPRELQLMVTDGFRLRKAEHRSVAVRGLDRAIDRSNPAPAHPAIVPSPSSPSSASSSAPRCSCRVACPPSSRALFRGETRRWVICRRKRPGPSRLHMRTFLDVGRLQPFLITHLTVSWDNNNPPNCYLERHGYGTPLVALILVSRWNGCFDVPRRVVKNPQTAPAPNRRRAGTMAGTTAALALMARCWHILTSPFFSLFSFFRRNLFFTTIMPASTKTPRVHRSPECGRPAATTTTATVPAPAVVMDALQSLSLSDANPRRSLARRMYHLKTKEECRLANDTINVWTVEMPSKHAESVLRIIKENIPGQDAIDLQHLRRFAKPKYLPSHVLGQRDIAKEMYAVPRAWEATPPSVMQAPITAVWEWATPNRARNMQRPQTLYLLICPTKVISEHDLRALLLEVPPFCSSADSWAYPLQIKEVTVPLLSPTSPQQADEWTAQYWPTFYRKTNPFGAHPASIDKAEHELHYPTEGNLGVEQAMKLANKIATMTKDEGVGVGTGCVIIERTEDKTEIISIAGDARFKSLSDKAPDTLSDGCQGNIMAHAAMRALGMVGRKRLRVATSAVSKAAAKAESNFHTVGLTADEAARDAFFLDLPLNGLEREHFVTDNIKPDGYLCLKLEVFLTHEPCIMCSMALVHSRVGRVIFEHRMPQTGGLTAERVSNETGPVGLGYGLCWRKELNWQFMCWEYKENTGRPPASSAAEAHGENDGEVARTAAPTPAQHHHRHPPASSSPSSSDQTVDETNADMDSFASIHV